MKPLAVCAIFKDEAPFLLEWIAYHRALGFDRFVLYDNDSTDGGAELVRSSPVSPHCLIIRWPGRPGQLSAYRHFIRSFSAQFEWAAFIDIDEFLLPLGDAGIRQLLQRWSKFAAVLVSWRVFGPSGWLEPPQGLIIENYDLRSADEMPVNHHIKSIVKCENLIDVLQNPHEFVVNGTVCNTAGRPVMNTAIQPQPCHENLVLNHYLTRSRHDWVAKIQRGSAMFASNEPKYKEELFDHFVEICNIKDETIKKWAPDVRTILREGPTIPPTNVSSRPVTGELAQSDTLSVACELVRLEPGLYNLSLAPGPFGAAQASPAARLNLPPGAAMQPQTIAISTFRSDGWLCADDEPALVRVSPAGAQLLVTLYWPASLGDAAKPGLLWQRLGTGRVPAGIAAPTANVSVDAAETLAHIQGTGDIAGNFGDWIGQPQSGRAIEGFQLSPPGITLEEIQYRAVLGRNWLSPWLPSGSFCGSRGLALPLRGFCLRLMGGTAARYDCAYSARFVDGSQVGRTASGQVCAAPTLAPLEAFQIMLRRRS